MPFFAGSSGNFGYGNVSDRMPWKYYRWNTTTAKSMPPNANTVQASEFIFMVDGSNLQSITTSATVTNSNGFFAVGEEPPKLVDNNLTTKMCDQKFVVNGNLTSVVFNFPTSQYFNGYRWATANDEETRDPSTWTIAGSMDGINWTLLHSVSAFSTFATRNTYLPIPFLMTSKGGSLYFNGTLTGNITIANDIDLRFGTGDFTIEWWQYPLANTSAFPRIFSMGTYAAQSYAVSFEGSDGSRTFYVWASAAYTIASNTNYINGWYHIAISRQSGTMNVYVNGTRLYTISNTTNLNNTTDTLCIGNESSASLATAYKGFISNFRIIKGTALYTGTTLTVPTTPLTPVTNTKLLIRGDTNSLYLTDSSYQAKTITNSGAVTWSSLSPF